ncbi:hypothetical protein C8J57DRAFT_1228352 [Mycena rebaudengoi]|nr:hypothetical protein C8J57DRAFT_1228352 [Mycena rebaudengoi]
MAQTRVERAESAGFGRSGLPLLDADAYQTLRDLHFPPFHPTHRRIERDIAVEILAVGSTEGATKKFPFLHDDAKGSFGGTAVGLEVGSSGTTDSRIEWHNLGHKIEEEEGQKRSQGVQRRSVYVTITSVGTIVEEPEGRQIKGYWYPKDCELILPILKPKNCE